MANKKVKKLINKLKTRVWFTLFNRYYDKLKLKENVLTAESRNGNELAGNIFYILKELTENKQDYNLKIYLSVVSRKKSDIKKMLDFYGIKGIKFVRTNSIGYYKRLCSSKFLLTDNTFPRRFIKKDGQVYLNTWHGTPLKTMGTDNKLEIFSMGNAMRNLFCADYLLYPNKYTEDIMLSRYTVENVSKGKVLREGYPRNTVFFDEQLRQDVKQKLGIENKRIYVYMPTWRGTVGKTNVDEQVEITLEYLRQLDSKLADDQIVFAKFHPMLRLTGGFDEFEHIRDFPSEYEYYQILNTADALITDYSSVFYDYANTGRKIILFTYDKEEYFRDRGVYVNIDDLPFPKVETVDQLVEELNSDKNYDDTEFMQTYCSYDNKDATKKICQKVFMNQNVIPEFDIPSNGKKNVLMYAGNLDKNGITTAIISMLDNLNLDKYNYFISFRETLLKCDPSRVEVIPEKPGIIPISSDINFDFKTARAYKKFNKTGKEKYKKKLGAAYAREIKRHFYGIDFDHVIHFNGYENNIILMLTQFDSKKTIFVHNDMVQEIETRGNQSAHILKWAYNICDNVVAVSEDIVEPTLQISGKSDNIRVISNFHNHDLVVLKGDMPIEFQKDTEIFCPHANGINYILSSPGIKFITIGRFSPEKGHFRLIDAFEKFHKNFPDSKLIIIGGAGKLYNKTIQKARMTECWEDIALIKSMQNPMPILKRCDLFILSSIYEGLGLVMLEADSLGVPVFSTDVHGPSNFLKEYGGYLVEDSEEGILQGMYDYANKKIKPMNIDYAKRNAAIRKQLEDIF